MLRGNSVHLRGLWPQQKVIWLEVKGSLSDQGAVGMKSALITEAGSREGLPGETTQPSSTQRAEWIKTFQNSLRAQSAKVGWVMTALLTVAMSLLSVQTSCKMRKLS